MSYPREARLEKYIKDLILDTLAEKVELHLKSGVITIKHITKKGCILLAKFWANVLQHEKNFPPDKFPYKQIKSSGAGADQLMLKAEDLTFTVYMKTGTLLIQGQYVFEWFARRFRDVLDNFKPEYGDTWHYVPSPVTSTAVSADPEPLNDYMTETERYLLCHTTQNTSHSDLVQRIADHTEGLVPGIGDLALDPHMWEGEKLSSELDTLKKGCVKDGSTYVYQLWRSLLHKWCGTTGTRVYLATPFLDADRLADIVEILLTHKPKMNLEVLYTRTHADEMGKKKTADIKQEVLDKFSQKIKPYIEYSIYRNIMYPMRRFHAKFIAAIKDDEAQVLVTSANFHGNHFTVENFETVVYIEMGKEEFLDKYINPIASPVVATV